jgi:hypothetical protein
MAARARALILAAAALAGGCATTRPELRTVAIEVPVPCTVAMPARPDMPTERLEVGGPLQAAAAAAFAEIDRREAYERQLVAALEECRR